MLGMEHPSASDPMNIRLLNFQPWRFNPGAHVYVRGWPADTTGLVTEQCRSTGFPHYLVVDGDGAEWCISQLQLSTRPITMEP